MEKKKEETKCCDCSVTELENGIRIEITGQKIMDRVKAMTSCCTDPKAMQEFMSKCCSTPSTKA